MHPLAHPPHPQDLLLLEAVPAPRHGDDVAHDLDQDLVREVQEVLTLADDIILKRRSIRSKLLGLYFKVKVCVENV